MGPGDGEDYEDDRDLGGFWRRMGAYVVDTVPISTLLAADRAGRTAHGGHRPLEGPRWPDAAR